MAAADTKSTDSNLLTLEDETFVVKGSDVIDIFGLECEVCRGLFDLQTKQPMLLPCKHTLCSDCIKKLKNLSKQCCPTCKDSFKNTTVPNDHRVMKCLDVVEKSRIKFKNTCLKHDCKKMDRFCETCNVPVCSDCIRFFHKNGDDSDDSDDNDEKHVIADLIKTLANMTTNLDDIERKCTTSLGQMRVKHDILQNVKCHLDANEQNQMSIIEKQFTFYSEKLLERKESLLTMVKEKTQKLNSNVSLEIQRLENSRSDLQRLYDQFTASRRDEDARVLFKTRKQLMGIKGNFSQFNVSSPESLCLTFEFKASDGDRMETEIAGIGALHEKFDLRLQCPSGSNTSY